MLRKILLILWMLSAFQIAHAEEYKKVAQAGMTFLKLDVGARAAGMGAAFNSMNGDVNCFFYNPAGLANLGATSVSFSRTDWIADITQYSAAAAMDFGHYGVVGIGYIGMDYGQMMGTKVSLVDPRGYIETGSFEVGDFCVGLSYSREMTDRFSLGGVIKWVQEDLGASVVGREYDSTTDVDNKVHGLAFDVGTYYRTGFKSLAITMSTKNFSKRFEYEDEPFNLPLTFTVGVGMDVMDFVTSEETHQLYVAVDALHPNDYSERLHLGTEYVFMNRFSLRGGYKVNYEEENFTLGGGIRQNLIGTDVEIDYSYSDHGSFFGSVQRFSLSCSF